eukprot:gnl/TRDRNA2_/TRDRNA2_187591_c0_seq1.p1 gnl/TRDRNA2_/TRDRNA2_187591_c0~~gnl/TRDRNA2_/TRDRNA2_187591_c0_seq1.p1  ORF type:complete len:486 (+),score=67.32 gnl/TRDRNA2_/TRDRNA2_187591_c0_seq1:49-1506(+)
MRTSFSMRIASMTLWGFSLQVVFVYGSTAAGLGECNANRQDQKQEKRAASSGQVLLQTGAKEKVEQGLLEDVEDKRKKKGDSFEHDPPPCKHGTSSTLETQCAATGLISEAGDELVLLQFLELKKHHRHRHHHHHHHGYDRLAAVLKMYDFQQTFLPSCSWERWQDKMLADERDAVWFALDVLQVADLRAFHYNGNREVDGDQVRVTRISGDHVTYTGGEQVTTTANLKPIRDKLYAQQPWAQNHPGDDEWKKWKLKNGEEKRQAWEQAMAQAPWVWLKKNHVPLFLRDIDGDSVNFGRTLEASVEYDRLMPVVAVDPNFVFNFNNKQMAAIGRSLHQEVVAAIANRRTRPYTYVRIQKDIGLSKGENAQVFDLKGEGGFGVAQDLQRNDVLLINDRRGQRETLDLGGDLTPEVYKVVGVVRYGIWISVDRTRYRLLCNCLTLGEEAPARRISEVDAFLTFPDASSDAKPKKKSRFKFKPFSRSD